MKKEYLDLSIPSLSGRKILITGASSGVGYETALALAYKGAELYLASRNKEKAAAAEGRIKKSLPEANIHQLFFDQGNLNSIHSLTEEIKDVDFYSIILNAAVYFPKKGLVSQDGTSLTYFTNAVGTYALLMELSKNHCKSRFVFVNSVVNRHPRKHDFSSYLHTYPASRSEQYGVSKRAVMSLALYAEKTLGLDVNMTHPGVSRTDILRTYAPLIKRLGNGFLYLFTHKSEVACLGEVMAASHLSPEGAYLVPSGLFHIRGIPKEAKFPLKKAARDRDGLILSLEINYPYLVS